MIKYSIKRLLLMIPLLFIITVIVFMFVHMIPGDPARLIAGSDATIDEIKLVREKYGLDQPLYQQYISYMSNLFQGDLGTSIQAGRPVADMLSERFMPTFWLTVVSMFWSLLFGIPIGLVSAVKRNKWQDHATMIFAVSAISIPSFWLGLMLMQLFSVQLGWLPTGGMDSWKHYILPSITLGAGVAAIIARFTRSAVMDVLKNDYIRTSRAKGLHEYTVLMKHAFRNAMIPVVTMTGLQFGFMLSGSIITETLFSWPGLGRLLINSIVSRDYPVIQAELLLFSFEFLLINLIVDLLYGWLNPKVRYGS
ncbi:glutathione ABC transporter permease GsiC [Bacillus vallismortis]|uniref:Glutathione transport system permease protein GsiC n=1 Tax=Bacillus vallismortis TaxID=72361 RepID=A0AAP3CNQ9_BACVA|nr:glutathione ABC transporter permease GsiC [Bacillus vallismortis]MCI4138903.1 glutathione ABC transporter permease GsiC [Bacillus vallismortis]MCY7894713.1 glutathione ABC transporter permease GsiC [Bacillus vallismortis]MCY7916965.1 glutathione ABC transporter permease GsiC [Bacillus vallismortis]MCY8318400.1 glutathione ABC transporter permease GsiC [Bacillus vallismortis]MCY8425899.1 glutathione ABC transporter permease GsiC [Bacillus vallismortis]